MKVGKWIESQTSRVTVEPLRAFIWFVSWREKQLFGKSEKFRFLHHHRLRIQRFFSTESSPLIGDACSRLEWCLQTAAGGWTLNKSPMTLDTLICVRKVVIKPAIIGPDVPLFTDESSENCRVLMTDFHSTLSRESRSVGEPRDAIIPIDNFTSVQHNKQQPHKNSGFRLDIYLISHFPFLPLTEPWA